jgi:hypothetical protein
MLSMELKLADRDNADVDSSALRLVGPNRLGLLKNIDPQIGSLATPNPENWLPTGTLCFDSLSAALTRNPLGKH